MLPRWSWLKPAHSIVAFAVLIAISVCVNFLSTGALGFSKRAERVADSQVQRLLQLMDKDKDGVVSKNEFIDFMSERFDRLDVNGDRRLEPVELRALRIPNWRAPPKEINRERAER